MAPFIQRLAPAAFALAAAFIVSACQASPAPTAAPSAGPLMHAKSLATETDEAEVQPEPQASEGLQVTNGTIVDTDEPEQFD